MFFKGRDIQTSPTPERDGGDQLRRACHGPWPSLKPDGAGLLSQSLEREGKNIAEKFQHNVLNSRKEVQ